ncbi:MAG: hypothetical protein LH468_07510 [Nocardioides sp.]|nr:hypothetical protein [Nocardioides sp.]
MRTAAAAVLTGLLVLGACSAQDETVSTPPPPARPAPTPPGDGETDASGSATCERVRAGIDAFNAGDYDETVARFAEAVPLAQAAEDDSAPGALLAEAVRYYADLAPGDYLAASQSSEEFERYKQVTLGLCVSDTAPLQAPSPQEPGVPA